jgi:periplasmic copper chaperone A
MWRTVAASTALIVLVSGAALVPSAAQTKRAAISSGWVRLPAAGAKQTESYVTIDNPTAYDVNFQTASSDAAEAVEIRAAGQNEPLTLLTVPAYESLEMTPKGTYLLLRNLKKPLSEGERVRVTLAPPAGTPLDVDAVVKKE